MKDKMKGSLALLGATVIWGFAFIAQSVGMDLIGPFTFQMVRCLLAVALLVPLSFLLDMGLFFETIGGVFGKARKMAAEKGKKAA